MWMRLLLGIVRIIAIVIRNIMNAAIGAVVVTPGAAVGFVFVDREVMWSGGKKIAAAAATTGDLPAAVATCAAFLHLAKNHCA